MRNTQKKSDILSEKRKSGMVLEKLDFPPESGHVYTYTCANENKIVAQICRGYRIYYICETNVCRKIIHAQLLWSFCYAFHHQWEQLTCNIYRRICVILFVRSIIFHFLYVVGFNQNCLHKKSYIFRSPG